LLDHHHESRTLVFVGDNETAYAVARENLVMPLTCDIGRKERDRALALFREGRLRALVSARVLNEDLDVPEAEVGIVVAVRRGQREHVQRIGRVLRPRAGKRALVYELVARDTQELRDSRRRQRALAG
jgi:superfamily II DNA or RNA helicase